MHLSISSLDENLIKIRCYIHVLIKNINVSDVLQHSLQFPMFYIKAQEVEQKIQLTFEDTVQYTQLQALPPMSLQQYVSQFKPMSLSHIIQSGNNVFVSVSHAISDGNVFRNFINSLGTPDALRVDDISISSPPIVFEKELSQLQFLQPTENRLRILNSEKSQIISTPFSVDLTKCQKCKNLFLNEKMNLFASLIIQKLNKEKENLIGVGNMVDLRQFSNSPGMHLNFVSGYNLAVQVADSVLVSDCLELLRSQFQSFKLQDHLMYWKAIQQQEWGYFATQKARVELSNAGRLQRDVELQLSADEAFSTLSVMFYVVGEELKGVVQCGCSFGEIGEQMAGDFQKLFLGCKLEMGIGELRALIAE